MASCVYIGLGSNLAEPIEQVLHAIDDIAALSDATLLAASSLYQTPPMGPQDQPHYINAVVKLATTLSPRVLLKQLQAIETRRGRTRDTGRWGARTLDLDILVYEGVTSDEPILTLPHPGLALRSFVLYPLLEIEPLIYIESLGSIQPLIEQLAEPCPRIIRCKSLDIQPSVC